MEAGLGFEQKIHPDGLRLPAGMTYAIVAKEKCRQIKTLGGVGTD
jgi:hypothetical protein